MPPLAPGTPFDQFGRLRRADRSPYTGLRHDTPGLVLRLQSGVDGDYRPVALSAGSLTRFVPDSIVESAVVPGRYRLCLSASHFVAGTVTEMVWSLPDGGVFDDRVPVAAEEDGGGNTGGGSIPDGFADDVADVVVSRILPTGEVFDGGVRAASTRHRIDVIQRDDYTAADGRAFEFQYTNPAIDFTRVQTVVPGPAAGGETQTLVGIPTLPDRNAGSAVIRIEFTSDQLNVPVATYPFDHHVVVGGRRITVLRADVSVGPKYADGPI